HNGAKDAGEPGVQNWTVNHTEGNTAYTARTAVNANYPFTTVVPGTSTLSAPVQARWVASQAVPPGTLTGTRQPRRSRHGHNSGDYPVTPLTTVDNRDPAFQAVGTGWTTNDGGYLGTYASHANTTGQSGNLIVNPGFETGDFSGWAGAPAPFRSYFGVTPNSHSGNYGVYFGSYLPPHRDDIYQNVPTIPGHAYRISYWIANEGGGSTEIRSSWDGNVLEDLFPDNAFPYEQHTFDVVATSTSTEFRIGGYQLPPPRRPEPAEQADVTN